MKVALYSPAAGEIGTEFAVIAECLWPRWLPLATAFRCAAAFVVNRPGYVRSLPHGYDERHLAGHFRHAWNAVLRGPPTGHLASQRALRALRDACRRSLGLPCAHCSTAFLKL